MYPGRLGCDPAPVRVVWVALAGAVGVAARYGLSVALGREGFPWVTLAINVVGSLLLGVLVGLTWDRDPRPAVVAIAGTGFLGGFTTFSTFSVEAAQFLREGRAGAAAGYVGVSVIAGIAAAAVGFTLARG